MIGECLDVLPDVRYYHRLAINDLLVTDCLTSPVDFLILFFSATKRLIKCWSTKPLLGD